MAPYCDRCDKSFRSFLSLQQHLDNSSFHNLCPVCDFDASTWTNLLSHGRREGCGPVCQGCRQGDGWIWSSPRAYSDHLVKYNVCRLCERHFETPANLAGHMLTHRSADYECLACNRKFKTYGGMIIHLESGACESGIDIIDLNQSAAVCFQWKKYVSKELRHYLQNGYNLDDEFAVKQYPYFCPTCDTKFPKLSSLFQHVESPACSQELDEGAILKLRRYLYVRHP